MCSFSLQAAPKAEYWAFWDKSNPASQNKINHSAWNSFLEQYVSENHNLNMFVLDYRSVSSADKQQLKSYLNTLQSIDPRNYSKNEQFAYWVNLYNALTVNLVLENYPVDTIKSIGSWFGLGPWDNEIASVAGQKLTLNDIEHRILRPIWKDSRIHYAVNCASIGCPDLFPQAWNGANVEDMLNAAAKRYIAQNKGVEFAGNELKLSSIYNWYGVDFGNRQQLLNHLASFSTPEQAKKLKGFNGDISYRYDWNLNQKP
ncbi:DUF547 domain-containing protein [Sansalvadorimonas sp. 2012CJ34-2]|uniref:DUF547 domain-containing protein n=1 Tax=Parendozoicomonas callyspongiae TaxID=2942213 RepID=A0ABT0PJQ2_9GAMM|nr:DUF547 domain-containing protein [Sansalvadorimonas sp. 2012CJ34-2]MCL6270967.1 DUF547 domain-containing protein [Sansalvadorimonas sp. 2012CJ34-2]